MEGKVQRARVFVKNLPFTTTETSLKEYFSKHGEISYINLLKKPSGQLVGCGFVQFINPHGAIQAVAATNGELFNGRKLACQMAVFKKHDAKKEEEVSVKVEEEDDEDENEVEIKEDVVKSDSDSENDYESDDEVKEEVEEKIELDKPVKQRIFSNDADEGKTVFVKNIPFTSTSAELQSCLSQFGPLEYGLVVMDRLTEHSKGTGFAKFKNKEDAEKCLEAGTELQMEGNILDCHIALTRDNLQKTSANRTDENMKDLPVMKKRNLKSTKQGKNLHLLNEGAVSAGSTSAQSVSVADMQLRLSLQQERHRRIRTDPNLFVSDLRLIVHNLPADWTEKHLRKLLTRHLPSKQTRQHCLREVRVMTQRDSTITSTTNSKCYAYVGCTDHEMALHVLREVNNNPTAFAENSVHKRPIVAFSLENREALRRKEARMEKSKEKNLPKDVNSKKSKKYNKTNRGNGNHGNGNNNVNNNSGNGNQGNNNNSGNSNQGNNNSVSGNQDNSVNNTATTGNSSSVVLGKNKSRLKHNVKRQMALHRDNIKQRKHKQRLNKPSREFKNKLKTSEKVVKQPMKKKAPSVDNFANIVNKYKSNLTSAKLGATKSKWYE